MDTSGSLFSAAFRSLGLNHLACALTSAGAVISQDSFLHVFLAWAGAQDVPFSADTITCQSLQASGMYFCTYKSLDLLPKYLQTRHHFRFTEVRSAPSHRGSAKSTTKGPDLYTNMYHVQSDFYRFTWLWTCGMINCARGLQPSPLPLTCLERVKRCLRGIVNIARRMEAWMMQRPCSSQLWWMTCRSFGFCRISNRSMDPPFSRCSNHSTSDHSVCCCIMCVTAVTVEQSE